MKLKYYQQIKFYLVFYYFGDQLKKKEYICKELKAGCLILKIDTKDIASYKMVVIFSYYHPLNLFNDSNSYK